MSGDSANAMDEKRKTRIETLLRYQNNSKRTKLGATTKTEEGAAIGGL